MKYFITILMALVLLVGCGRISDESGETDTQAEEETITPYDSAVETPIPREASFSSDTEYSDANYRVSVLGLEEYKKLKSDSYVDKASSGKRFLVLFLAVTNSTSETIYFHVDYISAIVDGETISTTYLVNEPQGYSSIFRNISSNERAKGFIVWEVPENWETLDVTYTGWKDSDGLTLNASFTRNDLSSPDAL